MAHKQYNIIYGPVVLCPGFTRSRATMQALCRNQGNEDEVFFGYKNPEEEGAKLQY